MASRSAPRVTRGQRRALGVLAIGAFVVFAWIAMPVGLGLFLGTLFAFTIEPLYHRLCARWGRPVLAAVLCSMGCTLLIAGSIGALAYALAAQSSAVVASLGDAMQSGLAPMSKLLRRAHMDPGDLAARVRASLGEAIGRAATAVATIATVTLHALLTLLFVALSTFFVLRHWRPLTMRIERMLPLHPMHTRALFRESQRAGRGILLGTLVTGFAQGAFAAIGYAIFGVSHAPLLGALTAIASIVPALGTLLVWVPVSIWLMASGHLGAGIGLVVYCLAIVIAGCDFVIRPLLVGRSERGVPTLLTFIAIFGGIEVFGVVGLVLGPVLASICLAILRTWEQVTTESESEPELETEPRPRRSSRPSWDQHAHH
ncbi:MAG: AI-2E family transporter [Polyangiales bacterium]